MSRRLLWRTTQVILSWSTFMSELDTKRSMLPIIVSKDMKKFTLLASNSSLTASDFSPSDVLTFWFPTWGELPCSVTDNTVAQKTQRSSAWQFLMDISMFFWSSSSAWGKFGSSRSGVTTHWRILELRCTLACSEPTISPFSSHALCSLWTVLVHLLRPPLNH